ncbi:MAG: hypothetical protein V7629_06140 [Motiliproteus sp.]
MKNLMFISGLCLLLNAPSGHSAEQDAALKHCQTIKDNIQRYTDKRRQGGNAAKMQNWRKKRNHYSTLYFKYDCKRYATALK